MNIDKELISKLEKLARLKLGPEEEEQIRQDLQSILDMVEKMNELDTNGVEPLVHLSETVNVFREDTIQDQYSQEEALQSAPEREGPYFKVPKVI